MDILTYAAAVNKAKKLIEESGGGIPIATTKKLGGVIVGDFLDVDSKGTLSVDVSDTIFPLDFRPVSSAAVYEVLGDIERALAAI